MVNAFLAILVAVFATVPETTSKLPLDESFESDGWIRVEPTARWCGAKGLWLLARANGREASLPRIRQLCDPDGNSEGLLNLADLRDAASQLGLYAVPIECRTEWLRAEHPVCLTVHRAKEGVNPGVAGIGHCFVLFDYVDGRFRLLDPYLPSKFIEMTDEEFEASFTGDALLVSSTPVQYATHSWASFLLILLLAADASFLAAVIRKTLRRGAAEANPMTAIALILATVLGCVGDAQTPAKPQRPSALVFDRPQIRGDSIVFSGKSPVRANCAFEFTNTSDSPVRILSATPGCSSCTRATFSQEPISPHAKGEIQVDFLIPDDHPVFFSEIELTTDEAGAEPLRLEYRAPITAAAYFVPAEVNFFEIVAGAPFAKDIEFRIPLGPEEPVPQLQLRTVTPTLEASAGEPRVDRLENGRRLATFGVRLTYSSPPIGGLKERLVVTADASTREHDIELGVLSRTRHPTIEAEPTDVNFGAIGSTPVTRTVRLRPQAPKTSLANLIARCDDQRITTRVASVADHPGWVDIHLDISSVGADVVKGDLVVQTDSNDPCQLHIPYFGYGLPDGSARSDLREPGFSRLPR